MRLAVLAAAAAASLAMLGPAVARSGTPQPARLARIAHAVFGQHWRAAVCVAHLESTDGAYLFNGPNLGPWQINVAAHTWVDRRRVVSDWLYAARVAYRLSDQGRDWRPWTVHRLCGA